MQELQLCIIIEQFTLAIFLATAYGVTAVLNIIELLYRAYFT